MEHIKRNIEIELCYCPKCKIKKSKISFFSFKDGKRDWLCKNCRLKDTDDSKPWTFYELFQLFDIPYIEYEWLILMERRIKKVISERKEYQSIFGQYLAKMKLMSWKSYTFKESAWLNKCQLEYLLKDENAYNEYINTKKILFSDRNFKNYMTMFGY